MRERICAIFLTVFSLHTLAMEYLGPFQTDNLKNNAPNNKLIKQNLISLFIPSFFLFIWEKKW